MKQEQVKEVIVSYLSRESEGSLILDTSDGSVEFSLDGNAINWGDYVVIESYSINSECECGAYYSDDCEQCSGRVEYLIDAIAAKR